jgi:uncharacterized protein
VTAGALPPVPFAAWLRGMQAALAEEAPSDVPCGACNACCRTSHFIHVRPEDWQATRRIPRELLFPAPGLPPGNLVMGYDETGCCPMLVCSKCTIYEHRPIACGTYDCRIYAATAVAADRPDIAAQVARWRFSYRSAEDRELHDAVLAALAFIREHPESLADPAARRDPLRLAVLAIAVHESFLGRGGEEAAARSRREERAAAGPRDEALARAVTAAHERLFGDL